MPELSPAISRIRRASSRAHDRLIDRPYVAAQRLYHDLGTALTYLPGDIGRDEIKGRKDFMRRAFKAIDLNGISGDYAEFGCDSATTFRLAFGASRLVGRPTHLWAFDSFAGLPELSQRDAHPNWVPGSMAITQEKLRRSCASIGMVDGDYTMVPGYYSATLGSNVPGDRPERIALAYVDCDLYSSTRDVLHFLVPRLQHGMILALDDYYCFAPDEVSGERLALAEVMAGEKTWRLVPYMQFGWHGMSFVVERRSLLPGSPEPW